jgi:hypothetical protein
LALIIRGGQELAIILDLIEFKGLSDLLLFLSGEFILPLGQFLAKCPTSPHWKQLLLGLYDFSLVGDIGTLDLC